MLTAKFTHPENGTEYHQSVAKAKLEVGIEYEVRSVVMDRYYTDIYLVGPTGAFNSVLFDFFEDGEPCDIYSSPKYNPYLEGGKGDG